MESDLTLGVISEVGIGMRDCDSPVLWFTVHVDECSASLQVFEWAKAAGIIKAYGKPCWVDRSELGLKWGRAWKEGQ